MKKTSTKPAKTTAAKETTAPVNQGYATFGIQGTVQSVYEGEAYDYARVRVYANGYYTDYNVACEKSVGIEAGDKCTFEGTISVYYDRNKNRYNTNYTANHVEPVETLFG